MSKFKTWLEGQLSELGISPTKLASFVTGLNQSTIYRILHPEKPGGTPSPGETTVKKITLAVSLAREKLGLLPSKDTNLAFQGAQFSNIEDAPDIKGRIPLISWVQAGMWNESVDVYEPGYAERWLPILKTNSDHTFALRVVGDSMTSRFGKSYPDGCIIFVDPDNRTPSNGDRIVAKLEGSDEVTFKVFTQDAGRVWLRPLNDMHPPIHDKFVVIGKVIGKWEDD